MKIFGFLNGLRREYDPITTVIQSSLSKLAPPTFNDVVSEVEGFDTKLQSYNESDSVNPHVAFQVQQSNHENTCRGGNKGRGRGFSGQNRGRGGYSTRGGGFSQHQTTSSNSGERSICQIYGRTCHTAVKCYNRFNNNYQGGEFALAFSSLQLYDEPGKEWHPDSGATSHITSTASSLQDVSTYEGNDTVMEGDEAYLPITHFGSATITSSSGTIPLNEICPDIQNSLLLVSRRCDDYPCGVYFDANKVCVIDLNLRCFRPYITL